MADRVEVELDSEEQSDGSGGVSDDEDDYGLHDQVEPQTDPGQRPFVPPLELRPIRGLSLPLQRNVGGCETRVDLLSNAFHFEREPLHRAMTERGMTLHGVVTAAFARSLGVPQDQLKLYHVNEITSPSQLQPNHHIAVSIQSSAFSLDALEDLIREQKEGKREAESQRRRLGEYEDEVKRLKRLLADARHGLSTKDVENRRLMQECEALRQTLNSQRPSTPSQLSSSSLSPRILPGGPAQPRMRAAMTRMQQAVAENEQLTSDVAFAVQQALQHALS